VRVLLTALILASWAVVPLAAAQTPGPSVPAPAPATRAAVPPPAPARLASTGAALDGKLGTATPRSKRTHRAAKKRVARHTTRKAQVTKAQATKRPAKVKPVSAARTVKESAAATPGRVRT
jgi:hypothetical protein